MPKTSKDYPIDLPNFATAPLFTRKEAAAYLRRSLSSIHRDIAAGRLKTVRIGDNAVRVLGDSLRACANEGGH